MSDIAVVPSGELVQTDALRADLVFVPGGVEAIISRIEERVRATRTDISTIAGRKAVASLAYKVARSKAALDRMGKDLTDEWRQRAEHVHADRRLIVKRLDALADEVRRPLTEWEDREKARVAALDRALGEMWALAEPEPPYTSADLHAKLAAFEARPPFDWQEFAQRAAEAARAIAAHLRDLIAKTEEAEAQAAELARLRAEEEERQRQEAERQRVEREARIAAEAARVARLEAEQLAAQRAAEAQRKAAEQAAEVARKAQAELDAAAERQRQAEELAARAERDRIAQAERDRLAAEEAQRVAAAAALEAEQKAEAEHRRLRREVEEAAERARQAEVARQVAARQAEQDREAAAAEAERRREAAALQAIAAERARTQAERDAAEAKVKKREADIAHRGRINREAVAAIVLAMSAEEGMHPYVAGRMAVTVVIAIAKGEVPHVRIEY